MKIGVTGSSGFIGKRLTKKLEDDGFEVFKFLMQLFTLQVSL
jgi:nucleoside-diphosphate-sugar epimerase